jgi:hypothetical protein
MTAHRRGSRYADHPRITWFGIGGTVAYVDYTGPTDSYFIGSDGHGGFHVISSLTAPDDQVVAGFDTIDAGIEYALAEADKEDT